MREGKFRITFAASRRGVLAVEVPPCGQVIPPPELTDDEVDAVLDSPSREQASDRRRAAIAAADDDEVYEAVFAGIPVCRTPQEAKAWYGRG